MLKLTYLQHTSLFLDRPGLWLVRRWMLKLWKMIQGERKLQTNNNKQHVPFITESHYIIRNNIIGSNNLNWILFVCLFVFIEERRFTLRYYSTNSSTFSVMFTHMTLFDVVDPSSEETLLPKRLS